MLALALVAGFARGLSGFGVGLIMMPAGAVLYGVSTMVPLVTLLDLPATLFLFRGAVRLCDRREVAWLGGAAVLGLPFGLWILMVVDQATMRRVVSVVVVLVAMARLAGFKLGGQPSLRRTLLIGWIAGLFNSSIGLPAPPVILGWVAGQVPGPTLRANIIAFFALTMLFAVPAYWSAGLFTAEVLRLAVSLVPIYLMGLWLGMACFPYVSPRAFQRLVLGLITGGALLALVA